MTEEPQQVTTEPQQITKEPRQMMKEPQRVTRKNPKKLEAGKRLAESNCNWLLHLLVQEKRATTRRSATK